MTNRPDHTVQAELERLCEALERAAEALVTIDIGTLLDTESALGALAVALHRTPRLDDATGIPALVSRARSALRRCRRLGDSFGTVADARLGLRAGTEGYRRDGSYVRAGAGPSSIHAVT